MFNAVKILTNVMDVNRFTVADEFQIHDGSYPITFTIRLWQADRNDRYIPATATTVKVEFLRADTIEQVPVSQTVLKIMSNSFTSDKSIWTCQLAQTDVGKIVTGGIRITIVETSGGSDTTTVVYSRMCIKKSPSSDDINC